MQTKIYLDGFWIESIDLSPDEDVETAALTSEVQAELEGRVIRSIVPLPETNPRIILITTEL